MKNKVILAAVFAIVMNAALAQGKEKKGNPCARIEKSSAWMRDSLGLNAEQAAELKTIDAEACAKLKAVKQDNTLNKDQKKDKAKSILKDRKKAISGLLTDNQKKVLNDRKKAKRKEPNPEKAAEKMTRKIQENLELSADQAVKIKQVNLDFINKRKAIKVGENGKDSGNREAMKKLHQEHEAAIKAILTLEQAQKWEELKKERKDKKHMQKGKK